METGSAGAAFAQGDCVWLFTQGEWQMRELISRAPLPGAGFRRAADYPGDEAWAAHVWVTGHRVGSRVRRDTAFLHPSRLHSSQPPDPDPGDFCRADGTRRVGPGGPGVPVRSAAATSLATLPGSLPIPTDLAQGPYLVAWEDGSPPSRGTVIGRAGSGGPGPDKFVMRRSLDGHTQTMTYADLREAAESATPRGKTRAKPKPRVAVAQPADSMSFDTWLTHHPFVGCPGVVLIPGFGGQHTKRGNPAQVPVPVAGRAVFQDPDPSKVRVWCDCSRDPTLGVLLSLEELAHANHVYCQRFSTPSITRRSRMHRSVPGTNPIPTADDFQDPILDDPTGGGQTRTVPEALAFFQSVRDKFQSPLELLPKGRGTVPRFIPKRVHHIYRASLAPVAARACPLTPGGRGDPRAQLMCELYPALIMSNLPRRSNDAVQEIKHRTRLFRSGAWEDLFAKANEAPRLPSVRGDDASSSLQEDDDKAAKAAGKAMSLGSVSKASQALMNPNLGVVHDLATAVAAFEAVLPSPGGRAPDLPVISEEVRDGLGGDAVPLCDSRDRYRSQLHDPALTRAPPPVLPGTYVKATSSSP